MPYSRTFFTASLIAASVVLAFFAAAEASTCLQTQKKCVRTVEKCVQTKKECAATSRRCVEQKSQCLARNRNGQCISSQQVCTRWQDQCVQYREVCAKREQECVQWQEVCVKWKNPQECYNSCLRTQQSCGDACSKKRDLIEQNRCINKCNSDYTDCLGRCNN